MKIIRIDSISAEGTPRIALIADSAMRADSRPVFLLDGQWLCELRLAVRIDRLGKFIAPKFAHRYYEFCSLVAYIHPAEADDAFFCMLDDSAIQGERFVIPADGSHPLELQLGNETSALTLNIDRQSINNALARLSQNVTFKNGDTLILPEPITTFVPQRDVRLTARFRGQEVLQFSFK